MDFWDPLLVNKIATERPVILLDNAGVGQSTGTVDTSVKAMAAHVIEFLSLLEIQQIDVLGFSMGGFVTQLLPLNAPAGLIRKIIITGSGPSYGEDVAQHSEERQKEVGTLAGQPTPSFENGFDKLFFFPSETSMAAGRAWWERIHERNASTSGEERSNLVSFEYSDGGVGLQNMVTLLSNYANPELRADGTYDRLGNISIPVLIGQGKDDFMIPSINSFVMQQKIPNAKLIVYPDSGHGFLYQWAEEFAVEVNKFLDSAI